jgi:hypothetical protein
MYASQSYSVYFVCWCPWSHFIHQHDTQLVSILYRTHKSLPPAAKVSSLYIFDALSRAARHQVNKQGLTGDINSETGNSATFLLKVEGVLEGLFQDMITVGSSESKVSCFVHWRDNKWCLATLAPNTATFRLGSECGMHNFYRSRVRVTFFNVHRCIYADRCLNYRVHPKGCSVLSWNVDH